MKKKMDARLTGWYYLLYGKTPTEKEYQEFLRTKHTLGRKKK